MKFFITERGDLSHQLEIASQRLAEAWRPGDALLAISKNADNPRLRNFLLSRKDHTIFHATITGFGGTKAEPGVSAPEQVFRGLESLIEDGFPAAQLVLRVDPIIPTPKGIKAAEAVIRRCPEGIERIRFSLIDAYPRIKPLLPWQSFHAPAEAQAEALSMLRASAAKKGAMLEACGEPQLPENRGCISLRDYDVLGLSHPIEPARKGQRSGCLCLSTKTEVLTKPRRCPNGCIYCYYSL